MGFRKKGFKKLSLIFLPFVILLSVFFLAMGPYFYSIYIQGSNKIELRDNAIFLQSSADGQLDIDADTQVEVTTTTIDLVSNDIDAGSGFWAGAPSKANNDLSDAFFYENDFVGEVLFPTATGIANGWKSVGDATYDVLSAAGTLGGWCLVTAETGTNAEVYIQMGQLGTETFVEFTASNSKKVWLEYNLTPVSVTNAANLFVGLAEEGAAAANFIADAGNDIADKDAVGFVVWEGDPNALLALYQTAGGAFNDTFTTAITVTNVTLGIYFDGATTITWYVDGTAIGSVETTQALFPDTEELSPIIAVKQGAADGGANFDWIKLVAER
jgi:hypothetical protein